MRVLSEFSRLCQSPRGALAIEAAFVLPVFLAFCLGTVEFGRLYWIRNSLQYSAEQAGRYALAHEDSSASDLQSVMTGDFGSVAHGTLNVNVCGDTQDGNNYVTIKATYQFDFLTGLVPIKPVTLEGKSRVPLFARKTPLTPVCS
jgi:Flp pilus assembly protein TadG